MLIDINCDMGEGIGNDQAIMPFITSANIACGYHAGDEQTMAATVLLAKEHNVHVGAHPSFLDRENFGRTEMPCTPEEVYLLTHKQLKVFNAITDECKVALHHVKPHGALYNMAARDRQLAHAFSQAVKDLNDRLVIYGLSNSYLISEATKLGLATKQEVFADRTYQDDGSLTPRSQANALIEDEEKAVQQILQMIQLKTVTSLSGKQVPILAETVCIHGDGKHAVEFARRLYASLHKLKP